MNCPEAIDVMGEAAEDRLDPSLRPGFEEHMLECPSCAAYYEQLRLTRKALGLLPRRGDTSPRRTELIEKFKEEFEGK